MVTFNGLITKVHRSYPMDGIIKTISDMRRVFNSLLLVQFLLLISCGKSKEVSSERDALVNEKLPRVAIAGIAIESSTFSPALTEEEAFHARTGNAVLDYYPFMHKDSADRGRANWFPTITGHALPGGTVTREAYDSLLKKTITMLQQDLPYDGLFLDIHGAMSVVGLDDAEGDFISRIREVVGYETLISTSMDLHGNVSKKLAKESDIITCYRMAPHEDAMESKQRALENLLDRLENGKGKPAFKAWVPIPILLPGEKTSTRIEPGKSLYAKVDPITKKQGVLDAAIWIGYAWADEPRNHAVVMVTGDDQKEVVESAEELAKSFWEARDEFVFVAPTATLEESMKMALQSDKKPFVISDMGDNPTAGGAGDVTWTIQEILKKAEFRSANGKTLIYASLPGPEFVEKAVNAGVGAQVEGLAGASVDDRYAPPVKLKGEITAIYKGDKNAEIEVVVKVGSASIIVTKKRKPYHKVSDFTNLGLNPREADILVVKIGYLVPELYDIRGDWIMALTPGGVDQDLERLDYRRINRPMFPLDEQFDTPDLSARLIPKSGV